MSERPAILMRRVGSGLRPLSDLDEAALKGFEANKTLRVSITQPRNVQQHRLYWAALKLVHDNMDDPPPLDRLHEAVKVRLGYFHTVTFKDGSEATVSVSIAFDKMSQPEFREYFEAFAKLVHDVIIPGLNSADLEREARLMLS